jgi:hypothetical protein
LASRITTDKNFKILMPAENKFQAPSAICSFSFNGLILNGFSNLPALEL